MNRSHKRLQGFDTTLMCAIPPPGVTKARGRRVTPPGGDAKKYEKGESFPDFKMSC